MRDIFPKIYSVIWPYVGSVYDNEFRVNYTLDSVFRVLQRGLEFFSINIRDMFEQSFKIAMATEDVPAFKKYRDDIIRLKELYSSWFINERPDFTEINLIVNKLEKGIPRLRQIITNEVRKYLLKNNQVYKVGTPIVSLYLV